MRIFERIHDLNLLPCSRHSHRKLVKRSGEGRRVRMLLYEVLHLDCKAKWTSVRSSRAAMKKRKAVGSILSSFECYRYIYKSVLQRGYSGLLRKCEYSAQFECRTSRQVIPAPSTASFPLLGLCALSAANTSEALASATGSRLGDGLAGLLLWHGCGLVRSVDAGACRLLENVLDKDHQSDQTDHVYLVASWLSVNEMLSSLNGVVGVSGSVTRHCD